MYASLDGCKLNDPQTWTLTAHDNNIYTQGSAGTVQCGSDVSLAEFAAKTGQEKNSVVHSEIPSNEQMMGWGRAVLIWPSRTSA